MKYRHKELLKRLAYLSFEASNGESLSDCVQFVKSYIEKAFPKSMVQFLNYYQIQLEKEYSRRLITIEVAGENIVSLENILGIIGAKEGPTKSIEVCKSSELIAGFRIRHQDCVWDTSVATQLKQLRYTLL